MLSNHQCNRRFNENKTKQNVAVKIVFSSFQPTKNKIVKTEVQNMQCRFTRRLDRGYTSGKTHKGSKQKHSSSNIKIKITIYTYTQS